MSKGRVVVMGSFVVDLMMRAERLPVTGETVKGKCFDIGAGGKGSNQAVAASRAGAHVTIITKLGKDEFSNIALRSYKENNMTTNYVVQDDGESTGAALIMVDDNTSDNKIIVNLGACNSVTHDDIDRAREEIINSDIYLTQLECNQDAVIYGIEVAYKAGIPVILNPAPAEAFDERVYRMIEYFTPNETEAELLSGIKIRNIEDAERASKWFLDRGVKNCIITMGSQGAYLNNGKKANLYPPFKVKAVDTTGAGDAFNGGLAAALAYGYELDEAIRFANATASLSVTKIGTAKAMPYREEINKLLEN